ncbi:MAG: ABC transporter permease [Chloroflexi bacterium]|nr:ABC transporter permease [Chloroflexota bacterium]
MSERALQESSPPISLWKRLQNGMDKQSIFSLFFALVGLFMLLTVPGHHADLGPAELTFGDQSGVGSIAVPTLPYGLVIAALYLVGGVVGLLPWHRAREIRGRWLLLNGALIIPTVLILAAAGNSINLVVFAQVSVRSSTPVVIGALAGIWCERSGVINIGIEGMMLTGAAFGFITLNLIMEGSDLHVQQAVTLGVLVAVLAGGLMALLHAWLCITFRTDQIVSGTVINILAIGVTSFLRREVLLNADAGRETLQNIHIPLLSDVPIIGEIFFQGRPIFYMMFVLLIATHVILYFTRWGLRTRAVGENPHAADTLGIDVQRNRWINVFIGGLIAGLAGAWFSLETTGSFYDEMTAGRGFIALAVMIFGNWTPIGVFGAGLLYGFSDALGFRFQTLDVAVPSQFLQMVPYVITLVVISGLVGRVFPPAAGGKPFVKE